MQVIESIKPFKINENVKRVILRISFKPIQSDESYTYLVDSDDRYNYNECLEALKNMKYIHSYSEMIPIGDSKYKERGAFTPIDFSKFKSSLLGINDKILFKIYFNKNGAKWDYIKEFSTTLNNDSNIDIEKINEIVVKYNLCNLKVKNYIKKLLLNYSEYSPKTNGILSEDELRDFLYFITYKFNENLSYIHGIRITENTDVILINGIIKDKETGKTIEELTKIENDIIKKLKKFNTKGGISRENLIKITKQTADAFKQSIKILRRKLKDVGLENHIQIKFNSVEKVYTIFIKE